MRFRSVFFAVAVFLSILSGFLSGCGTGGNNSQLGREKGKDVSLEVSDPVTFRSLYSSEVETLNYLVTYTAVDTALSANLIDSLVDYDSYGNIRPGLAESWSSNEEMTEWTFKIRQGAAWYDSNGKYYAPVTANDWVTAAQYVNNAVNDSETQYMYSLGAVVEKAKDYYDYTSYLKSPENHKFAPRQIEASEIGVIAQDDYTLIYYLEQPCPFFLSVLSYTSYLPVNKQFLEEQGESFGKGKENLLYNGAFILTEFEPLKEHIMRKNPGYWDAGNVHIDVVHDIYNPNASTEDEKLYLAGEIDKANIDTDELDSAMKNPQMAGEIHQSRPDPSWSYFYTFNFNPRFDNKYEPDNWLKAVNNENFRLSIMTGLDRLSALKVYEPDDPELLLINTITPPASLAAEGHDYTLYAPLAEITKGDSFDPEKALLYRDKAKEELSKTGVKFPIKVLMPYNPATEGWLQESRIVERQLEELLGNDYIDIIIEAGPETYFLAEVRMSGKYAFMKCRWGADYADPQTWTEPFAWDGYYNFWNLSKDRRITILYDAWLSKVSRAADFYDNDFKRYKYFAEAESLLIEHAIAIPFSISPGDGYVMSRLNPFEGEYAPYGLANQRYKGFYLHDKSMSIKEFEEAYEEWLKKAIVDDTP